MLRARGLMFHLKLEKRKYTRSLRCWHTSYLAAVLRGTCCPRCAADCSDGVVPFVFLSPPTDLIKTFSPSHNFPLKRGTVGSGVDGRVKGGVQI